MVSAGPYVYAGAVCRNVPDIRKAAARSEQRPLSCFANHILDYRPADAARDSPSFVDPEACDDPEACCEAWLPSALAIGI